MHLQLGQAHEVVTVEALAAQLSYDRHTIDGVVTKQQIDSLPLNGRSFLQLAQLQPGVSVSPASIGEYNRQFDVNILGAGSESVRITVDGATVNDAVTWKCRPQSPLAFLRAGHLEIATEFHADLRPRLVV
jgi:TonB-dependent Receptor Plug Domain